MSDLLSLSQLRTLEDKIRNTVEHVSIRGVREGAFLYATHHGRAVEAWTNGERWWVEFWERSDDELAHSVREESEISEDDALQELLLWLYG